MRALLLTALTCAFAAAAHAQSFAPTVEPFDCAQITRIPEGAAPDCGYLLVPENRADPQSRTLRVPYARLRSTAANPAPEPLIMMMGGPGSRTIPSGLWINHPVLAQRDVIWFEQRGARLTQPPLLCEEYAEAGRRAALGQIGPDELARQRIAAASACAAQARAEGADLSGYTSVAIAADIEDLRRALGYARVNLYGVSYSGRVMTEVARDYPGSVRAIVLNTPLPIEANYDEHGSANMRRTLNMMFDACAIDAACAAGYPQLREQLSDLMDAARRNPITIDVEDETAPNGEASVRVTEWVLANAILDQLYNPGSLERLPRRIDAIHRGDHAVLREILDVSRSGYPWLMRIAVWCNEEYGFEDEAAIRRQRTDYPEFAGVDQSTVPPGLCAAAGFTEAPPARENEPVATDTSVLIITGDLDPATPPAWSAAMARHMPNAHLVVFPWGGHVVGFGRCGWQLSAAFLANPGAPLDATCLFAERGLNFMEAQD